MEFMPMSFANMYGYLLEFDTLSDIGYNQYSYPVSYTTHPAAVLAEHRHDGWHYCIGRL